MRRSVENRRYAEDRETVSLIPLRSLPFPAPQTPLYSPQEHPVIIAAAAGGKRIATRTRTMSAQRTEARKRKEKEVSFDVLPYLFSLSFHPSS